MSPHPTEIRAGSLPGRLIVVLSDGAVEGICRKAVEDPYTGRVLGFAFEDDTWYEGPKFLPQEAVTGYGESALLIEDRGKILQLHQAAEIRLILKQRESLIEKHVMTDAGKYLGEVFDYDFDATGKILHYYIHRFLAGDQASFLVPASRTGRVGKNLILVGEGQLIPTPLKPPLGTPWAESAREARITPTAKTLEALKQTPVRGPGAKPEPRPPAPPLPGMEREGSLADRFTQRQYAYLLGRRCERDIHDDGGMLVVRQGHLIDQASIDAAREAGKFMELAIASRSGGTLAGQTGAAA